MPINALAGYNQTFYGDAIPFYYTGKNTSGAAISGAVPAGDGAVFCFDPANITSTGNDGLGQAVTQPETANLSAFAGIAVGVPANFTSGVVMLRPMSFNCAALTKSNMTKQTTKLGPTAGQWYLSTIAAPAALANVQDAVLQTVGLALETVDTSGAAAPGTVKRVCIRPNAG